MEKRLEDFTDPELSYLAVDLSYDYQLIVKDTRIAVMDIVAGLYEVDQETYKYCRKMLEDWMYTIADMLTSREEAEELGENDPGYRPPGYRPMGFGGSWRDNPEPDD